MRLISLLMATASFVGSSAPPVEHTPMLTAWLAANEVAPSKRYLDAYAAFFASVPDILAKRDIAYITAAHSGQASRLNLIDPSKFYCSIAGAPKFEAGKGIVGATDGKSYYNTGFIPDGTGGHKLDQAEIDVFVTTNDFDPNTANPQEFGNDLNFVRVLTTQLVSGAPNAIQGRINRNATATAVASNVGITSAIGLTSIARKTVDGFVQIYRNGEFLILNGGAAQGFGNGPFQIGAVYNSSGSVRRISFCSAGALLTDEERVRWYDAIGALLIELGAYNPADETLPGNPNIADPYAPDASNVWTQAYAGTELDMGDLVETHVSDFTDPATIATITKDGGPGLWGAPIRSTVGSAPFVAPDSAVSPFEHADGVLRIRCDYVGNDYQTGHMQTANLQGEGFSQTKGYFEAKIKMPPWRAWGAWPAFWLYGNEMYTKPSATRPEIDIIEYYPGNDPNGHHSALHLRPGGPYQTGEVSQHWGTGLYTKDYEIKNGAYHLYGCEVTDDWIIIYHDRKEIKRFPALDEFKVPLFMLVSLQMLPQERSRVVPPFDMHVEYVRVWQRGSIPVSLDTAA